VLLFLFHAKVVEGKAQLKRELAAGTARKELLFLLHAGGIGAQRTTFRPFDIVICRGE